MNKIDGSVLMTLVKYRIFRKVVDTGSFTKAALDLNMTQSAVSHAISTLERDMGFSLFKRIKNKIELTTEGQSILNHVNALLSAECKLINEVHALNKLEAGVIRIGSFRSASSRLLTPIIKAFEKAYPNVRIELMEGSYPDIRKWLDEDIIDVAFLVDTYLNDEHYAIPYFKDEMLALLPLDWEYKSDYFDMASVDQYPFIMPQNACSKYLDNVLKKYKIKPDVKYVIQLNSTVVSMIEQGLGISIVAESTLFRSDNKVRVLPLKERFYRQIYITTNTAEIESPIIRGFFDMAKGVSIQ